MLSLVDIFYFKIIVQIYRIIKSKAQCITFLQNILKNILKEVKHHTLYILIGQDINNSFQKSFFNFQFSNKSYNFSTMYMIENGFILK